MDVDTESVARQARAVLAPFTKHLAAPPTVWTVLRHVSRSETTWVIDPMLIVNDEPLSLRAIGIAAGYRADRERNGLVIQGGGMDMGVDMWNGIARAVEVWAAANNERCPEHLMRHYIHRWL